MKYLGSVLMILCLGMLAFGGLAMDASAKQPEGRGPDKIGQSGNSGHGNGGNNGNGSGHNRGAGKYDVGDFLDDAGLVGAGITLEAARRLALDYDLTGYSALPPGIAKNLARGKPLPPGIARKMVPGNMLGKLPVHPGYEWRVAGADLILVSVGTAVVADVLRDVFR